MLYFYLSIISIYHLFISLSSNLGQEDPLEKEMATHSSILAWRSPWTEEPGRLQSIGLQSRTWLSDLAHAQSISMVCWSQLILIQESWHIYFQEFYKLVRVMLVAWKWPWQNNLDHEDWLMTQIRDFFFLLESQLLNNLPEYHYRFGMERDFLYSSVYSKSNNSFLKIPKLKKEVFFSI